jgi:hypothetical protein
MRISYDEDLPGYTIDMGCYYIGDFPLLRDGDPALARSLEERAGRLMALKTPFDTENPVYAVEVTVPARGSQRPEGEGGHPPAMTYPSVNAGDTEGKRSMALRLCPITAFDTLNPTQDSDRGDSQNGPIGRTSFPVFIRYFE